MAKVDNKEFKKYGGYLFPSVTDLTTQIVDFGEKVRPKSFQFTLIAFLTILIGVTASLTRSPQAFMAGPINSSTSTFEFDESKYVSSTSYLIAFGITKAFGNVICGMLCDTIGRRPVHILGWFIAIPIPIMIILAPNWSTVVAADMFLGFNQAFTWMTSIIMMVDLAGPSHRGIAIGMSESIASIADACLSLAAANLINKDAKDYRSKPYYVVAAAIGFGFFLAILFLKETKYSASESKKLERISVEEGGIIQDITPEESPEARSLLYIPARATVTWPSGKNRSVHVLHMAFVETSFLNISLMSICFAGMMVNFVTGLGWGLSVKWLRLGVAGKWAPLTIVQTSYVALVYGIVRGVTQFVSGFFSDEFGRRDIIVFGLTLDAIALIIVAFTGQFVEGFDANYGIFLFCAALNGLGTGSSYPSLLAAVIDHTDESYKAAALGSYRFWRDLGYAIGAIVSAAIADSIGIPKSVGITGGLIALAAITVAFFYEERRTDGMTVAIPMENNGNYAENQFDSMDKIPASSSEKGSQLRA